VARIALYAAAVVYAVSVVLSAGALPEQVPLHFGLGGSADRYGSRSEALTGFGALGAFLLALWLVVRWAVRRTGLDLVNVPHADYWKTPEREPELRRRVEDDLTWFFAATVLLLAALPVSTVAAADGSGQLPRWFPVLFGAYLLGTLGWCVHQFTRRWRPPAES
jgi:hypothetical protein